MTEVTAFFLHYCFFDYFAIDFFVIVYIVVDITILCFCSYGC